MRVLFKIIFVAFLLTIIAQGGVARHLAQRLKQISAKYGELLHRYLDVRKSLVSMAYPRQESLTRLQSTVGSTPVIPAQWVSQFTSINPSSIYFPNPEGPFSHSISNRVVVLALRGYPSNRIPEKFKGIMGAPKSIIIERRLYQPLIGKANSGTELLSVRPPSDFPGRQFNQKPFTELYPLAESLFNGALRRFERKVESLSYYPIAERIDLSHNLAQCKYYFKSKAHNALPLIFSLRNSDLVVNSAIPIALANGKAIVSIHCDNSHPTTAYYTLVWYPGDPRYSIANMMLHLSRVHDNFATISFHPLSSISESIEHFESNLESLRAAVCTPKFTENLRVVWSTIGDTETTPK